MQYSRFQRYALSEGGGSASRRSGSASHAYRHRNNRQCRAHNDPRHNQERNGKYNDDAAASE
jgi:hypothetical protein